MQRIKITTSLSRQPYEPLSGYHGHMVLKTLWTITFEFRYHNAKGEVAMDRTLEYRLETAHGWPFPERELCRMRVDIRRGPYNDTVGFPDSRHAAFRFDEDYEIHLEDAGQIGAFFEGVFDMTDFVEPNPKQLTHGQQALPAADH